LQNTINRYIFIEETETGEKLMKTVQLTINLPDMHNTNETYLKMFLSAKLYERQELSLGQAADAAGVPKRAFAEMLGLYGVSLFSQNMDDLKEDIANA
jgi:predicted HTH domain antitoxin